MNKQLALFTIFLCLVSHLEYAIRDTKGDLLESIFIRGDGSIGPLTASI